MIGMGWAQSNDRAVLVIEAFASLVPMRQLQAFLCPEPFDFLVVYPPSLNTQQLRDFAIAITTVLLRQADHGEPQCVIVFRCGLVLQRAASKANGLAGATL